MVLQIKGDQPKGVGSTSQTASPSAPSSEQAQKEKRLKVIGSIIASLNTPITFYGKVIDQNGDPVPEANVDYGVIDRFDADGSNYTGKADEKGGISKSGIHGAVLTVGIWKKGYYNIHSKSDMAFADGIGPDPTRKPPPTKANPAVFILQKMGETGPLFYAGTRYYKMAKDGQPLEINLETGKEASRGQGNIRVERWANDTAKDKNGRFDWRLRISVPSGGLVERHGQFEFVAPEEGYQLSDEINMPASLNEKWQYTVNKSFFVKLPDGRYARIDITIQAGHNNTPFILDSYLNPDPGHRNLEFDPAKAIKP